MKKLTAKYIVYLTLFISILLVFAGKPQAQESGSAVSSASTPTTSNASATTSSTASQPVTASSQPSGQPSITPQQANVYQNMTPAQQQAIQQELGKTGGQLTPQAIETLKSRPEFQNLSPVEIEKGKQLLQQTEQDKNQSPEKGKEPIEKKELPWEGKTVISEPAAEDSLFERSRKIGKYQDVSLNLRLFGSDFFRESAIRVLTDRKDIPVPLKYVVGPGDEVKLMLWGRLNAQYNLTIDRDGKITIPQIGPIYVAGMTFEDMSKHLITQAQQIVGTNIDISMGALKSISVFILGDVRKPGAYTIGSFATITDALVMAGGTSTIGSMRRVQLRRKNHLITTFDLYDLLLKGDKSKDVILQAGDVIFVPVTGPLVGITGNVKRPAIYELKDKHDLQNLISYAGGIIPTAYTQQIQVERVIKGEKHIVVDIDDKNLERATDFGLQDLDLVKIFSIVDSNVNAIYLSGNVKRPGKYEYKPGMTLKDIISKPDELLPESYFDYALIKRLKPPSMEALLVPFNLGKFIFQHDPANNVALQPQDQIFIFNKNFFEDKYTFTITGEVRKGGRFDLTQNFRIKDAILAAGDLSKEAYLKKGELVRVNKQREYNTIYFDVAKAVAGNEEENLVLQDEDKIVIHSIWEEKWREEVTISGEIKNPLSTRLMTSMRISDLVFKAGGTTRNTYYEQAELYRTDWRTKEVTLQQINLSKALNGDPQHDILLKDLDRVVIHSLVEKIFKKTVTIEGDVHNPGTFQFAEGMTVSDLVFAAGNVLESVHLDDAEISSMEINKSKTAEISVRHFNLGKALTGDQLNNIQLKPYDRVFVKRITDWRRDVYASIAGEVRHPGRYALRKGEKLSSLIERAGGYTKEAYLRAAIFTRQSVKELQQKSIKEMAERMEKELLSSGIEQVSTSISKEDLAAKMSEMEQKKKFIADLKQTQAKGRMTVYLADLKLLKGSEYDFELEEGDTLTIPEKSSVVNVIGSVMSSGTHIYSEKMSSQNYIDVAGGYSYYADKSNVYILKVDGTARKIDKKFIGWSSSRTRWEMTAYGGEIREIEPGDTIVVPEQVERIAWLREIKDITQILMQLAVVAGVAIAAL